MKANQTKLASKLEDYKITDAELLITQRELNDCNETIVSNFTSVTDPIQMRDLASISVITLTIIIYLSQGLVELQLICNWVIFALFIVQYLSQQYQTFFSQCKTDVLERLS